jgi:hypothetical protein
MLKYFFINALKSTNIARQSKAHLNEINMSYSEHKHRSLEFSKIMLVASTKAFIHGYIPAFYETSSSEAVKTLNEKIKLPSKEPNP